MPNHFNFTYLFSIYFIFEFSGVYNFGHVNTRLDSVKHFQLFLQILPGVSHKLLKDFIFNHGNFPFEFTILR
jgi:hypothetical protein